MKFRMKQFISRVLPLMLFDAIIVVCMSLLGVALSKMLLPEEIFTTESMATLGRYILPFILFVCTSNLIVGLYSSLWTYAGYIEFVKLVFTVFIQFVLLALFLRFENDPLHPLTLILAGALTLLLMGLLRFGYRLARRLIPRFTSGRYLHSKRTLLVGAGEAGALIIRMMLDHPERRGLPVVLVDDDRKKHGLKIYGVPVRGDRHAIPRLVKQMGIERIIIAIPLIHAIDMKELIEICLSTQCQVLKTDMTDMLAGDIRHHELIFPDVDKDEVEQIQEEDPLSQTARIPVVKLGQITPQDLLGRPSVEMDIEEARKSIRGKTILVTGGGGSIGSELCRQLLPFAPGLLLILDIYENTAYELYYELTRDYPQQAIEIIVASVRDLDKIQRTFEQYRPHAIFHAAAHKHVPLMEHDPEEAIKNNVFGTYHVAKMAGEYGSERFTLISTDKAVNPTNVMGASKRMCEFIVKGLSETYPETTYNAVRFGNVLGSHGSAFPLFQSQIAAGGPVTVTHPEIERYFMTIPEAARLVIEASSMAENGEIYILDMGDPVNIDDMARKMIRLAGFEPDVDIAIQYIGLRPGEKMYEELSMSSEELLPTKKPSIMKAQDQGVSAEVLEVKLERLRIAIMKPQSMMEVLQEVVPTYHPRNEMNEDERQGVDHVS